MHALLTSMDAKVFVLTLTATHTDAALREIAKEHRGILLQCGLDDAWLDKFAYDALEMEPQWDGHVRQFCWWACNSNEESDDKVVSIYLIDGVCAKTSHTGFFIDSDSTCIRMDVDMSSADALQQATYDRLRLGLTTCAEDTQKCYSPEWVAEHELHMPPMLQIAPGIQLYQWRSDRGDEDWRDLRLFVFQNKY